MATDLQTSRRNAGGVGSTSWSDSFSCSTEYIISAKTKSFSVYPEKAECKQRELALQGMHFSQWQLSPQSCLLA